jgi:hypothetical protein
MSGMRHITKKDTYGDVTRAYLQYWTGVSGAPSIYELEVTDRRWRSIGKAHRSVGYWKTKS